MLKIGICGAGGRMGEAILKVLLEKGHTLGAAFEVESFPHMGEDAGCMASQASLDVKINPINADDAGKVDGIIDFSNPEATMKLLDVAREKKKPLVIGTTGITEEQMKIVDETSRDIPVLISPNMSLGVNLFFKLTEIAAKILGSDFDIEIFEAHHRFKKDAPSGTAKKLLEIVQNSVPESRNTDDVYDRSKNSSMRRDDEIGMMTLRGGDIVGDHTVHFAGMGERIELTHRASSREIFARGAVLAMEFLADKGNGLYNMFDALRL